MKSKKDNGVFEAIRMAAMSHHLLTAGTILCVAASVVASLLPPLLLAGIIDRLTAGIPLTFAAVLLYFGSLALELSLIHIFGLNVGKDCGKRQKRAMPQHMAGL